MLEGTVIGPFGIGREETGRELPGPEMVRHTVTAYPLARAGFIGTIAVLQVFIFFTFHASYLRRVIAVQ